MILTRLICRPIYMCRIKVQIKIFTRYRLNIIQLPTNPKQIFLNIFLKLY